MEPLQAQLAKIALDTTFEYDPAAHLQMKADSLNKTEGTLNREDGYECSLCRNRGYIAKVEEDRLVVGDCRCMEARKAVRRLRRSGLKDVIRLYTFERFEAREPWQQTLKEAAMDYARNPEGWFALCGQSGCGKTHLCTAICRELLLSGRNVRYMLWRDEIVRLKQGGEELQDLLESFKTAQVLYIDDLFKTGDGRPTAADINYAFEILNYRYNNPSLLTILSSELTEDELLAVDEAVGGRIYERAKAFTIGRSREKNYRLGKAVRL